MENHSFCKVQFKLFWNSPKFNPATFLIKCKAQFACEFNRINIFGFNVPKNGFPVSPSLMN